MIEKAKKLLAFILKAIGGLLIFGGVIGGFTVAEKSHGIAAFVVVLYSVIGGLIFVGGHALSGKGPLLDRTMENETRGLRYVDSTLADGEEIVLAPRQSRWEYMTFLLFAVFFAMLLSAVIPRIAGIFVLFGLPLMMLFLWLERYSIEQAMTSRNRIIMKKGLIARATRQIDGNHLEGAKVLQTYMGRLFGYGDIVFSGTGGKKVHWRMVAGVMEVNKKINDHILSKTTPTVKQ